MYNKKKPQGESGIFSAKKVEIGRSKLYLFRDGDIAYLFFLGGSVTVVVPVSWVI